MGKPTPDSLLGLHAAFPAAFTAPSACLQDENTIREVREPAQGPTARPGQGPQGDLEKGIPFCTPAPDEGCAQHPTAPEGPSASPRWARLAPPGEPRAGALTPGPRASPPVPAELRTQPRAPPAKPPPLAAAGEPFRTADPGPGVCPAPTCPKWFGAPLPAAEVWEGCGSRRGGCGERGPFLRGSGVGTCPHGALRLEGTKNPRGRRRIRAQPRTTVLTLMMWPPPW